MAGFSVVGVDVNPQPNYPFEFIQADALTLDPKFLASFDAIHASPPCHAYSDLAKRNGNGHKWPRLIEPIRKMLIRSGLPYIIENVDGAPLLHPVVLCRTMFRVQLTPPKPFLPLAKKSLSQGVNNPVMGAGDLPR